MAGHILVVDDDPDICDVLRDRLESYGYPVVVAGDGRAALLSINQVVPRGLISTYSCPTLMAWKSCAKPERAILFSPSS